ncbi:HAMP domain-containing histidine kinase [Paenibacillus sp. P96]|uniref:histidine kinase n=1 Tax=Paenibacillus zeirhizosphaerae TaxID=2987519 RepID=A0ABT9FRJ3_9BACL|nr:HAMP domain-containing sensor histidine kinase [Paenibacillus sp. P96]MDP4097136.1 HAMP domain-containing histidine kinase [Paenibacillus sp. P96]
MINTLFQSALKQEIGYSLKENDILRASLDKELSKTYQSAAAFYTDEAVSKLEQRQLRDSLIKSALETITVSTSNGTVPFRISSSNYLTIHTTGTPGFDNELIKRLDHSTQGYEVVPLGEQYFIRVASAIVSDGETFYLETYRDITSLFKSRENQYQVFYGLIFGMIGLSFILILFVAYWLTKPIKTLARATKSIAEGDFKLPAFQDSNDEIGLLAKAFRHMSRSLEHMVAELEDAARRQEHFIASFAHELKTPMTSIIGYADMLRSRNVEQEQMILYANHIFQEGRRLEALSLKLMDLIVLKKQQFNMKRVPASHLFESVQSVISPILKREGIELVMEADEANLLIEPDLMKTVCLNLLDNARKSIETEGCIRFLGKMDNKGYSIIITDNGKGMEPEELSKITEAFYMADQSRSRAEGGAGLGLTICSQIIEMHHAEMDFESVPGQGTSVYIRFKEVCGK